ncbi:MAG: hypothetical protein CTY16_08810 [Methylobacter sp.]|nr:MAG: hypothetical protein CTY16_08810 [Methylobacter sp.]
MALTWLTFYHIMKSRVLVARLFLLFKSYYICFCSSEKAVPLEANLRVHDRAAGGVQGRAALSAYVGDRCLA